MPRQCFVEVTNDFQKQYFFYISVKIYSSTIAVICSTILRRLCSLRIISSKKFHLSALMNSSTWIYSIFENWIPLYEVNFGVIKRNWNTNWMVTWVWWVFQISKTNSVYINFQFHEIKKSSKAPVENIFFLYLNKCLEYQRSQIRR